MSIKQILSIEAVKLKRPANFILLGLLLLIYLGMTFGAFYKFSIEISGEDSKGLFEYIISIESRFTAFFTAIFIIMNIGKEYSDGTLRKNMIDGFTRDNFYKGKLLMLLLVIIIIYIFGKLVLITGGLIVGELKECLEFLTLPVIINSFLRIVTTGFFAFFLIFLTRSITISIVVYFVWSIIETLAVEFFKFVFDIKGLDKFLPQSSIQGVISTGSIIDTSAVVIACFYIFLMLFIPYYLLLKRDIK